ncbi:MAG: sporulation integral membrane protein YtvI [Eubacteriales bacterium]
MTPITSHQRYLLYGRVSLRILLLIGVILGLFWGIPPFFNLFSPFIFGFLLAALINPCVLFLQRKLGFRRPILSFFLVLLLFIGMIGGTCYALFCTFDELTLTLDSLPSILQHVVTELHLSLERAFHSLSPSAAAWAEQIAFHFVQNFEGWIPTLLANLTSCFWGFMQSLPSFFLSFLVFLMGSYFLTAEYPYLCTKLSSWVNQDILYLFSQVKSTALTAFGGYLRAQFFLSVGVFLILFVGFLVIGQSYSLLLSLFIACLDFIPFIGAGLILIPWTIVALAMGNLSLGGELFVIWCVTALARRIAEPKIMGEQTGISPLLSLVSIYVGLKMGGILAMIFAPILVLILSNLYKIGIFSGYQRDFAMILEDFSFLLKLKINQ